MKIVAALSLLVVGCLADPGSGSGGYRQQYFSPHELDAAAEKAHRIANEKISLAAKLASLKDQQVDLLEALANITSQDIPAFMSARTEQDGRLEDIRDDIKTQIHSVNDLEALLAGEVAATERVEGAVNPLIAQISALQASNNDQNGDLAGIALFLNEAEEKLEEKVNSAAARASDSIREVAQNTKALADRENLKQCYEESVLVEIDPATAQGNETVDFGDRFQGQIPVVSCFLQAFVSHVKLGHEQSYRIHAYGDEQKNIATGVDCQASADGITVRAFDQSNGVGNDVYRVYVQILACTRSGTA